jgi:amino acid transporter
MSKEARGKAKIGYWSAAAIGVGGMVGGGIFAVLGLATELSAGGTPIAFAAAGAVALVTSYSYSRLSIPYPSQGGTVEFLNQAFGVGLVTGGLNVLLWISYVVMLSLYAHAFGSYGASFFPQAAQPFWYHLLMSAAIVGFTVLNAMGAAAVGNLENWIVALKIVILLTFVGVGLASVRLRWLAPATWSAPLELAAGGMIIFLAYEGFELIANTAADVQDPERTLPRAYYSAVAFVVFLYIVVAVVTVGNLPIPQIAAARDYALAAAARPFLGSFGFGLIAVAALLSTGSAINATLYGSARLSYTIAKEGELPESLERKVWPRPIEGLLITSGLTLLLANSLDLSSISVMGSAGFLLIFAAVNAANVRLSARIGSNPYVAGCGLAACTLALGALIWQRAKAAPVELVVLPAMVGLAFAIEAAYRRITGRQLRHLLSPDSQQMRR